MKNSGSASDHERFQRCCETLPPPGRCPLLKSELFMKSHGPKIGFLLIFTPALLLFGGCNSAHGDPRAEAPPPATVVADTDVNLFSVDHPEQFPLTTAVAHSAAPKLVVTGTVNPDISRNVPVISLATGRVVAIHARLGDTVKKGQALLSIRSDDVAGGFSDYRKALADETLARTQLERAKELYDHGAISMNDLQVAQDTEDKAKVDVETMAEHLRLLGRREHLLPYRAAGGPHLAIRPILNMKALFEAGWSEFLSTRLRPFSARAKERGLQPRLT
jgi:hypothetical protein